MPPRINLAELVTTEMNTARCSAFSSAIEYGGGRVSASSRGVPARISSRVNSTRLDNASRLDPVLRGQIRSGRPRPST
jgi:hypothetical protein